MPKHDVVEQWYLTCGGETFRATYMRCPACDSTGFSKEET